MASIKDELIKFLRTNKISTTELADSLAKTGGIPALLPIIAESYAVGVAHCIFTANGSNYYVHEQVTAIQPGEIALIFSEYCEGRAVFGDIIARYILEVKKATAVVVQGAIRDADEIRESGYPVWSQGFAPIGCVNIPTVPFPADQEHSLRQKYENCILVCDGCGVVAILEKYQNEDTLRRLQALRVQEQVWNHCIFELGWNTYETICQKRYLKEPEVLPAEFAEKLDLLQTNFAKKPTVTSE